MTLFLITMVAGAYALNIFTLSLLFRERDLRRASMAERDIAWTNKIYIIVRKIIMEGN